MRKYIRSFLQLFGYDIVKYKPRYARGKLDEAGLKAEYKWLLQYGFKTIIDVGANEGQFSDRIRILFPDAFIHAFEPLPIVFQTLEKNFENDQKFKAYNLGLGENKEELELYENEYSPSSSFLKLTASMADNFENAIKTKKVTVFADRMDQLFSSQKIDSPLLIKIDVQGFEDKVISGGTGTLQKAQVIICELSFVGLYEGQLLFGDLYEKFKELGFVFAGVVEQVKSPETNQVLQADGIFIKQ